MYGLCLPLAALVGFFLANPLQSSSMIVLAMVAGVLCWPVFVRWYHPLLVGALHSFFILAFLPGAMPLWTIFAFGGFLIAVFHRSLNPEIRLIPPGSVPWALITLGVVVAITALVRGGVGLKTLGSASTGGKKYIYILLAIMAYFVLVSRPVPRKWALAYMAVFCLSALTSLLSHLVFMAGSKFYWLFAIIDSGPAQGQAAAEWNLPGQALFRSTASLAVAGAIIGIMLARFGLRESFNLKKPWRWLLLLACIAGGILGGFRSFLVGTGLMFGVLFILEGLHRTHYLTVLTAVGLVSFGALTTFSDRLPASVQRSLSFLPVKIDALVRQDAQVSLEWRLKMWDLLMRDVPHYLTLGKGYAIDPGALQLSDFNAAMGYGIQAEWAVLSGEYHNGPLSVLIPFGLWGALALVWLLLAGSWRLYWLCRHGDRELLNINRALCAMFIAKIIFFLLFFGSLYSDLVEFAALLGLAESLNVAARSDDHDAMKPDLGESEMEEQP